MKALSLFLPFVLPSVPGCTDPLAEQAILSACIEFADAGVVQAILDDSTIVGQPDYDLSPPQSTRILTVLSAHYLDRELQSRALDNITSGVALRGTSAGTATTTNGTPSEWFMRDPAGNTVSIYPPPDTAIAGALTFRVSVVPTRTATSVPDTLYDDYAQDIADGALARLMMMPGQVFTQTKLAGDYAKSFQAAVSRARSVARTAAVRGSLFVRPRSFA